MDSAMDLSLRNITSSPPQTLRLVSNPVNIMSPSSSSTIPKLSESSNEGKGVVQIVRPIPRPPWSILWYQNLWSISATTDQQNGQEIATVNRDMKTGENSKTCRATTAFRTNERSSFSVLNSLCTNTVNFNSCGNNNDNNYTFPHIPMEQQQQQHISNNQIPFQFPMIVDKCNPAMLPVAKSVSFGVTTTGTSLCKLKQRQDVGIRSKYSSEEDESDSDNSENIVVTTTRDSMTGTPLLDKQDLTECLLGDNLHPHHDRAHQTTAILDVACCDGPVQFKRVSNPNFALTVEHNEVSRPASPPAILNTSNIVAEKTETYQYQYDHQRSFSSSKSITSEGGYHFNNGANEVTDLNIATAKTITPTTTVTTHKSYLCIYCNQSFKSLFCYQKHKKRHLNPVSVDITTTTANSTSYRGSGGGGSGSCLANKKGNTGSGASNGGGGSGGGGGGGGIIGIIPENTKAKTKDLNVQFFPCKKCGCKFPSYYFVHKHKKICH